MKIKTEVQYDWNRYFDWLIIPTIMIGFRNMDETFHKYGLGIGLLFLKGKIEFRFYLD